MGLSSLPLRLLKAFLPVRLLKAGGGYLLASFRRDLALAQEEAAQDAGRLISGVILLISAAVLFGAAAFALSAASVVALRQYTQLDWLGAILVVSAVDIGCGVLLALVGKSRFKGPILKKTRGMMKETISDISSLREA